MRFWKHQAQHDWWNSRCVQDQSLKTHWRYNKGDRYWYLLHKEFGRKQNLGNISIYRKWLRHDTSPLTEVVRTVRKHHARSTRDLENPNVGRFAKYNSCKTRSKFSLVSIETRYAFLRLSNVADQECGARVSTSLFGRRDQTLHWTSSSSSWGSRNERS